MKRYLGNDRQMVVEPRNDIFKYLNYHFVRFSLKKRVISIFVKLKFLICAACSLIQSFAHGWIGYDIGFSMQN